MLPTKLQLDVVTPEKKLVSAQVDEVILPGREGYLGVLPGHAPLLTSLKVGMVWYRQGSEVHLLSLAWGFAEVLPEKVTILADVGERAEEIDVERARAKKAEIERRMKEGGEEFDFAKAQAALQKALVRIEVVEIQARRRGTGPETHVQRGGVPKSDITS
jgi:F-type H+-transporting ATPase subunit epsilon